MDNSTLNKKGEWVKAEPMKCPTQFEVACEYFVLEIWRPLVKKFSRIKIDNLHNCRRCDAENLIVVSFTLRRCQKCNYLTDLDKYW